MPTFIYSFLTHFGRVLAPPLSCGFFSLMCGFPDKELVRGLDEVLGDSSVSVPGKAHAAAGGAACPQAAEAPVQPPPPAEQAPAPQSPELAHGSARSHPRERLRAGVGFGGPGLERA